jgi:CRISPR/Cas system-associated exonuclease Cas4 (RecB family)
LASATAGELARFGAPEDWPKFELKRARLLRLTRRLRDLLDALPDDVTLATEMPLSACEGRLYGVADLVVRSPRSHKIVDYKTGTVVDRLSGEVREAYKRQLQMYAYLEAETFGTWPETAHLLPLEGQPVEIEVDPEACAALAEEAIDLLEEFNADTPGPQPGSPGPAACESCHFVAMCPAFWDAYATGWGDDLVAAAGTVLRVRSSPLGGITLDLETSADEDARNLLVIRNIDPEGVPVAGMAVPGAEAYAVGLREETTRGTYRLLPWGALFVRVADDPRLTGAGAAGPGNV